MPLLVPHYRSGHPKSAKIACLCLPSAAEVAVRFRPCTLRRTRRPPKKDLSMDISIQYYECISAVQCRQVAPFCRYDVRPLVVQATVQALSG